jgi:hypothetical protein
VDSVQGHQTDPTFFVAVSALLDLLFALLNQNLVSIFFIVATFVACVCTISVTCPSLRCDADTARSALQPASKLLGRCGVSGEVCSG